jgi:hypothetical protein
MTRSCPHCRSIQIQWKARAQKWECQDCEARFDGDPPAIAPDPLADVESAYLDRAKALAHHADWVDAVETGVASFPVPEQTVGNTENCRGQSR